ncbi:MAG: membrane protein insertase YidC [Alphaproteobacteria bacterium]|nr:membrane protein insertase YidC [Alphaproteobacteria bacterium]
MTDNKNLILAIALSVLVVIGYSMFIEQPRQLAEQQRQAALQAETQTATNQGTAPAPGISGGVTAPSGAPVMPATIIPDVAESRAAALAESPRITIKAPSVTGSIALKGARIDDVVLSNYRETLDPASPPIHLFEPTALRKPYYAEFGWVTAPNTPVKLPTADTVWIADKTLLEPGTPVTLRWDNGEGLTFERRIALDEEYLFTVTQTVRNASKAAVTLYPYGLLSRGGTPSILGFYILHEGPLGVFDETLKEIDYSDLQEDGDIKVASQGGWIGLTDKYWLAALIPGKDGRWDYNFRHTIRNQDDRYQVDFLGQPETVAAGALATAESRLFAGAKLVSLLDRYADEYGITNFDLAIDFGWFYFLTKPFFFILNYFNSVLGNFGLAILALTVVIKLLFFPLANKSYRSMAKLKTLTPKMKEMREKYGDDRQRLNEEMMAMYKREKVNPAAGCLPILIQIPVFFSLYKVLFVNIEMRHAPFYGWVKDLSAPDPTTLFNLFGLIPWTPPELLMIGAWPVIMGITMFLQQKLNPQPADPVQAKVFMFLPLLFTVLLSQFAAGLVIYWTWNNLLSILQQWVIMKRMGVKNTLS